MKLVTTSIALSELEPMSKKMFNSIVKAVVDIEREVMVVDAEMHADEEAFLLENASEQRNLWGINLHPSLYGTDDFVEFDSMINIRPIDDNRSRTIINPKLRDKIKALVNKLVTR